MIISRLCLLSFLLILVGLSACSELNGTVEDREEYYESALPCTRWWWFATEIKESDVKHQLDWAKENNFGGVEIAWVYPLYRYKWMYKRDYGRNYPVDTTAQKWLSPEWSEIVAYTKQYATSIGLSCDFTFGSAWPVAGSNIGKEHTSMIYGDTSFRQTLTFSWAWPDTQLVINHLDSNAFNRFAEPVGQALTEALGGPRSALFTDSWEIKLNYRNKIWTPGFETTFQDRFQYDIIPYMDEGLDSFPDVRYDYMMHLDDYVTNGFYKPYVRKCRELGAWSRVQCLASPTDVMTTYGMVDIPETEAMLNNPNYSRIVSSAAALSSKYMVSCESFTCVYGFPATYLREEQTADLKLVADALFAQGVNKHIYHGTPYNPAGSDTIEFFATTYFGPGGSLEPELADFNAYIGKVSEIMQTGRTYSDVAVYIPYEDGVMQGAYPRERRRVWVWGEYELRYVDPPEEVEGYHPLWINRHFLEEGSYRKGIFQVGDARFKALYVDVNYMDHRALQRIFQLAQQGLPVCLKGQPAEPGFRKSDDYAATLDALVALPNVSDDFDDVIGHRPLIEGDSIPWYWCRVDPSDGTHYLFLAQPMSRGVVYPVYSGQSLMKESIVRELTFNVNDQVVHEFVEFKPYQSVLLKITAEGYVEHMDIEFVPADPVVRPREKQRTYF